MKTGRRGFLGALAAAPLAAKALFEQQKVSMLTGNGSSLGSALTAGMGINMPPSDRGALRFMDFSTFLKKTENQLRLQAKNFTGFDPDIVDMRLPLSTKIRFQRERNYHRILESQKAWFESQLERTGFVEFWG